MPGPDERGGESESPQARMADGGYGADPPRAHDRPARGSVDDLRRRQDGLPHGHPSSRFNDDGSLKPPLVPLKNLELPDDERETDGTGRDPARPERRQPSDSRADRAGEQEPPVLGSQLRQPEARRPEASRPEARRPEPRPEARQPETSQPEAWRPELRPESWQPVAAQPDTPQRETRERHGPAEQQDTRDEPAAEDRWATLGRESAVLAPELTDDRSVTPDEQLNHEGAAFSGYGHHSEAERDGDPDADRDADTHPGLPVQDQEVIADEPTPSSADQPQARSAEGLTPEQVRIAVRALGRCRLAEGRSVFGSYGERGLTPAMRNIEEQLEHGELAPDTEKYALKSLDRFQEKLAKLIDEEPGTSPEELAEGIHDGIRYTFIFQEGNYTLGVQDIRVRLEGQGYTLHLLRNLWNQSEYKGINSRWQDPASGKMFEIQFHTRLSWEAKQHTHDAYEKINSITTLASEKERLRAYQSEVSSAIPLPAACLEIAEYQKED